MRCCGGMQRRDDGMLEEDGKLTEGRKGGRDGEGVKDMDEPWNCVRDIRQCE